MGETIPPQSKSQPASERDEDPHESVTIAPPAPNFEDMLRYATPVPSLSNRSDQHFRAALDAGTRAGSSLSDLSKIVAELSGGLSGAKQANEQLVHELSTLRAMLGSANEQQLALKHRLAQLEQELTTSQQELTTSQQELASVLQEAEREKQFLTEQHDDFLAALIEEHEEALLDQSSDRETTRMGADVSDLTQKLVQTEAARLQAENEATQAREALSKARAQRDEAQARAEKRERERDELRAEASQLRARLGTHRTSSTAPPPPVASARPPSFHPAAALRLDAAELDSTLHTRSSTPRLPSVKPRLTPPPAELSQAVYTPRPAGLTPPPSKATSGNKTAREFPHESTRPGVGGPKPSNPPPPVDFGPPPSGWTPVPPAPDASTAPPRAVSAASLPAGLPSMRPVLKPKLDPTTRPLTDYSLGGDGLASETLEGVRLSSKPPRK
jgi:predicted  nucleic acid-binding Zn-ribbon protein